MTWHERILRGVRGEPPDRVPWVPRPDLWYRASLRRGTLPERWRRFSLPEILDDLGVGRHEVIQDFLDVEHPDEVADQALFLPGGRYDDFRASVGDSGVAVALANVAASPTRHLPKELVPYDQLYFDLHDHPDLIAETGRRMLGFFRSVASACAQSSAEVLLLGANYDVMLTPPPFFAEHITPVERFLFGPPPGGYIPHREA